MFDLIQFITVPFTACLIMILIFGYMGIHVLEREIIFIDIAFAQVATLGAITALILFKAEHDSIFVFITAISFTFFVSFFYAATRRRITQISLETIIGISYAIAAATALFLVAMSAEGHGHVGHMLSGSIMWARWTDILLWIPVFAIISLFFVIFRKNFEILSKNYDMAISNGIHVIWWDFFFYALFGIVITLTVRTAGILLVFSFLVIPTTVSAMFSQKTLNRLIIAWIFGISAATAGLLFSYYFDFSVGPSIASFLGLLLILCAIVKKIIPP